MNAIHRDVLKLIRSYARAAQPDATWWHIEIQVIQKYKDWISSMIGRYPTTLEDDETLLSLVE